MAGGGLLLRFFLLLLLVELVMAAGFVCSDGEFVVTCGSLWW